ncbi:MAG: molybdopterin-dependent oxidoreductase [Gammaproteobacteria bacterium]|nr:molybdopterin-dependent oxidoreductase [Gammaproteobacteria bacterium]
MTVTRREFLQASGVLVVCFALPGCTRETTAGKAGYARLGNRLRINANGTVELMLGKVEFGQGIGTALAQMVAEELDIDFGRVHLSSVDTDRSPDESYTFSSISIQQSGPPTRRAAAQARGLLLTRAAERLDQPVDTLRVVDGEVLTGNVATNLNYWRLIGDEEITIDLTEQVMLKSVSDYSIVGRSLERIDIPGKVFGDASFLQDLRLPNMVHARVVRPAAERASVKTIDTAKIEKLPGVLSVVRDGNFIAVIAEREGQARRAANLLRETISWVLPSDLPDSDKIYQWLRNAESREEPVASRSSESDVGSTTTVKASYQRPFQAHASISPSAAIALYDNGKLTVWSHAQGMYPLRGAIAQVLGMDIENIRCVHCEASGCYGHNGADDAACDAAALAVKFPGRPVRLQWERRDEMTWEPYGSAMHIEISADVDETGTVRAWDYDLWSCPHSSRPRNAEQSGNLIYAQHRAAPAELPPPQSIPQPNGGADRNAVPLYTFDNMDVVKHLVTDRPMRVSALRGLGAYANVFAIESFMDELAARSQEDAIAYRLRHLDDERAIAVLKRLMDVSAWSRRPPAGSGEGWGIGFARFKNRSAWVGVVMRVIVKNGNISLQHASAVCDAGLIINPDGAGAQIEGGIVQSASWTLKEQIRFDNDRKQSVDWVSYPILGFDETPTITVDFMERSNQPSLGIGEAAQGPTAAAIANALYHATGQRQRRLPLSA